MRLRIAVLAACLMAVGLASSASFGEDAVLAEIYGRGVHAYFGGQYEVAQAELTDAITQGSKDPRCFYYRGLALFSLGRLEEANSDFAMGAKEEVKDVALSALASRSLARVQGSTRMLIEKARQTARKEHRAEQVTTEKARYEEWQSNEKRMLRTPPAEEVKPAETTKPEEAKPEEPKAEEAKPEAPAKPEEPKAETPPAKPAEDPFGGAPPAAEKPAAPATPAPATPPPAKDPFGG